MATTLAVPRRPTAVRTKRRSLVKDFADAGIATYPMTRVLAHLRRGVRDFRRMSGRWRYVWPLAWLCVWAFGGRGSGWRYAVANCISAVLERFGGDENVQAFQNAGTRWVRVPYDEYEDAVPMGIQGVLARAELATPDAKTYVYALAGDPFVTRVREKTGEETCIGYWNAPGFLYDMDPGNSA